MMNRLLLMSMMLLATSGCASSYVANLEARLADANRQIAELQRSNSTSTNQSFSCHEQLDRCNEERYTLRASEPARLLSQLKECRARSAQERRDGFIAGQYNVLNSIEVAGVPRKDPGFFSDDFYYQFQIRVNGRRYAFVEVQTLRKENAIGSLLGKIGDIAQVIGAAAK